MLEQADSHRGAGRPSSDRDDHTVVIGGSVAELLAARVLVTTSSRCGCRQSGRSQPPPVRRYLTEQPTNTKWLSESQVRVPSSAMLADRVPADGPTRGPPVPD